MGHKKKFYQEKLVDSAIEASESFHEEELREVFLEEMGKPSSAMAEVANNSHHPVQDIQTEIETLLTTLRFPRRSSKYRRLVKEFDETLMQERCARASMSLKADMESGRIPHPDQMVREMYRHNPNQIF